MTHSNPASLSLASVASGNVGLQGFQASEGAGLMTLAALRMQPESGELFFSVEKGLGTIADQDLIELIKKMKLFFSQCKDSIFFKPKHPQCTNVDFQTDKVPVNIIYADINGGQFGLTSRQPG